MKKVLAVTVVAVSILAAGSAKADYVDLFNTNAQNLDSSLAMRRSTAEQFNPIRGQSVTSRPRPDFDPVPVPVGSFQLFPTMNLGSYYDSNIFATQNATTGDLVWKMNPTATLASNWGRHAVAFTGLGDFNYYSNNNEQDYHAGAFQAEGRYDIAKETWVDSSAAYQRVAEIRGGPTTSGNTVGPSEYDLYSGGVKAYRGVGLLKTSADYSASYYDFDPVEIIGGGTANQNGRNRIENFTSGEAGYDLTENFQPFVRGGYNWRQYTGGGIGSSNGYNIDVGSKMDFGGITTASAYVGYMAQNYVNFTNGLVDALDFGANILWNVTPLTSVEGSARRSFQESLTNGASAILSSEGGVSVTHELQRNVLLEASVKYYALDYQRINRHDDLYDAGTGVRYFINRHLYSDLTYDFESKKAGVPNSDYDRNVLFLRVGIQY